MKISKSILLATPFLVAASCCEKGPEPPGETPQPCVLPQGTPTPAAGEITAGCYRVCKLSGLDDHRDPAAAAVKGVHLAASDLVTHRSIM